jgi:hypothetical protein
VRVLDSASETLTKIQRWALLVVVAVGALALYGAFSDNQQFFRSYLLAYVFWADLSLGFLGLTLLHQMSGGRWGDTVQRLFEAGTNTLPLMAVAFIPIALNLARIYPWAAQAAAASDPLLAHKAVYLNPAAFIGRTAFYFVLWMGFAWLMNRWWRARDEGKSGPSARSEQGFGGLGLVVFVLTASFASIDWVMSLEPDWFSSVYGLIFIVGEILAALTFVIFMLSRLVGGDMAAEAEVKDVEGYPRPVADLRNLTVAFVILWAYMQFAQFIITWSGNTDEEIVWVLHRGTGGWQAITLTLIVLHFFLPFLLLISPPFKRSFKALAGLAGVLFLLRWLETFWMTMPAYYTQGLTIHWMDIALSVVLGGLWVGWFATLLRRAPAPLINVPKSSRREALEGG